MIDGNIKGEIQIKKSVPNEIGEQVLTWETVDEVNGFLDLQTGESKYRTYNAKIEESSHIFICDYKALNELITNENSRMVVKGKVYDIKFIDNPMELNKQLEFYLKFTGGQNE